MLREHPVRYESSVKMQFAETTLLRGLYFYAERFRLSLVGQGCGLYLEGWEWRHNRTWQEWPAFCMLWPGRAWQVGDSGAPIGDGHDGPGCCLAESSWFLA